MLKLLLLFSLFSLLSSVAFSEEIAKTIYDFKVQDIDGKEVNLADYKDKVVLIVNVASKCGYTKQYKELVEIHNQYSEKGFAVLGFPANEFNGQEPGSNEEIKKYCENTHAVKFPMFSKIIVKGEGIEPLFQHLTEANNPDFKGDIKWNFEKFLIGPDGKLKRRYNSKTIPNSAAITTAIESLLEKK